jgi:type III secretion protein Q
MTALAAETISAPTAAGLRGRLPGYAVDNVPLLRQLFERPRRWTISGSSSSFWFEPRLAEPRPAGERIGIVINGRPGELLLTAGLPDAIGELDWSDYAGTARLTAWTLAHRRPMTRLARVFESILLPQSLVDAGAPVTKGLLAIGFRLGDDQGIDDEGVLRIEPCLLRRLLDRAGSGNPAPVRRPAWRHLSATIRLSARGPQLSVSELRALESGDVLLLGERSCAFSNLHVIPDTGDVIGGWAASWNDGRVRIDAPASWTIDDSRSNEMNDTTENAPDPQNDPAQAPIDPLAQLPLRIDFTLGETSIPLAKLASFEPGYVFDLASHLDNARVGIRANGKHIGHGRLVAIGDTLGVQLEGWEVDGLQ